MKKLTALALTLSIILSAFALAACDKQPGNNNNTDGSVYEIVAAAIEKTLKAKSFEANLSSGLKTDLMGNKS